MAVTLTSGHAYDESGGDELANTSNCRGKVGRSSFSIIRTLHQMYDRKLSMQEQRPS